MNTIIRSDFSFVYKVVVLKGRKKFSSNMSGLPNHLIVGAMTTGILEYKPNKWTVPTVPNSKLFVFSDFKAAKDFAFGEKTARIFFGVAKNKVLAGQHNSPFNRLELDYIDPFYVSQFWLGEKLNSTHFHRTSSLPDNTYFCDAFLPLELVNDKNHAKVIGKYSFAHKQLREYYSDKNRNIISNSAVKPFNMNYKVGEWTLPKFEKSKLFVYSQVSPKLSMNLYDCVVKNMSPVVSSKSKRLSINAYFTNTEASAFWKSLQSTNMLKYPRLYDVVDVFPPNTYFADAVFILENRLTTP